MGAYGFGLQLRVAELWNPEQGAPFSFRLYYDGELRRSVDGVIRGGDFDIFGIGPSVQFQTPDAADLTFSQQRSVIYAGEQNALSLSPIYGNCVPGGTWIPDRDPVTLTITRGSNLADLAVGGEKIPNVTKLISDLAGVSLVAKDSIPEVDDDTVTIQASVNSVVKTVSCSIRSFNGITFVIRDCPDSVNYGGDGYLSVQAVDGNGDDVYVLPANLTLSFSVVSGSEFLQFYDWDTGDWVPGLSNVTPSYGSVETYVGAHGAEVTSRQMARIRVAASDPRCGSEERDIDILPNPIIVTVSPQTVNLGESASISLQLRQDDGTATAFPADAECEFQMADNYDVGLLYSPDRQQWGNDIYGAFQSATFTASRNTDLPPQTDLAINVWTPYGPGTGRLQVINKQGCIAVKFARSPVSPGDTVLLSFTKSDENGVPVPIPADQMLDVFLMNSEADHGYISSGDGSDASVLTGVTQPIFYVAPSSITADSIVVNIRATKSAPIAVSVRGTQPSGKAKTGRTDISSKTTTSSTSAKLTSALIRALAEDVCPMQAGMVVVTTLNHPPVITKVLHTPTRHYFSVDSVVQINAVVTDPDGDAVTVNYLPSQSIKVAKPGPNLLTIQATDSKGAMTIVTDTVFGVRVSVSPVLFNVVKDGENITYEADVFPSYVSTNAIAWTWAPKDVGAGNEPKVHFEPDDHAQTATVAKARWYAFPDDPCGAKPQSTYILSSHVVLDEDGFDASAEMMVYLPKLGGVTTPPQIIGAPDMVSVFDVTGNTVKWRVYSRGTLARQVGSVTVNVPVTSQFYTKLLAHENFHVQQQTTGTARDIFSADNLWSRLKGLERKTSAALIEEVQKRIAAYRRQQTVIWNNGSDAREVEARDFSDPIPPRVPSINDPKKRTLPQTKQT